jgi:hypothetical protein
VLFGDMLRASQELLRCGDIANSEGRRDDARTLVDESRRIRIERSNRPGLSRATPVEPDDTKELA